MTQTQNKSAYRSGFVTIIGSPNVGKSTLMNCISGYSKPTAGEVLVNEVGLYQNFDMLKHIIGYVPQRAEPKS